MWTNNENLSIRPSSHKRRKKFFIDKEFQLKYLYSAIISSVIGLGTLFTPILYYLNQSYSQLIELAYINSPEIVDHLQNEKSWMNFILISSIFSITVFIYILVLKMTMKVAGPIKVLTNHINQLSRGLWYIKPVKVRDDDEFQETIDSYNYFYQSFRNSLIQELDTLESLQIDSMKFNNHKLWKSLIEDRKEQLGIKRPFEPTVISSSDVEVHGSRHVS